ncbi:MAG: hypothetical protein BWY87_01070 [Deltaproteobacteria bacterium ADurb.Bin510]|nr:MAG: hypothetical protein BWY87_01070 [Deltaproteobacteria bacterium ADurb.Bin510]
MVVSLTRREILEQLVRLGIRDWRELKQACSGFERYWRRQFKPTA